MDIPGGGGGGLYPSPRTSDDAPCKFKPSKLNLFQHQMALLHPTYLLLICVSTWNPFCALLVNIRISVQDQIS